MTSKRRRMDLRSTRSSANNNRNRTSTRRSNNSNTLTSTQSETNLLTQAQSPALSSTATTSASSQSSIQPILEMSLINSLIEAPVSPSSAYPITHMLNSHIINNESDTNDNVLSSYNRNDFFKTDHSNKLLTILDKQRNDESLCDYEVRVNGKSFFCHKCVLIAMSDFFKVMLMGSMKESRENYVELKGFKTFGGIKLILDFIYTGILNISFGNLNDILDAASHLQVGEVLALCEDFLIKNLTILNCVSIHKIADLYALNNVLNATEQYLSDNIVEIYQHGCDQFYQLSYEQLKVLLSNDSLQVFSELDLFLMISKWIQATGSNLITSKANNAAKTNNEPSIDDDDDDESSNDRLKYAPDLIKSIRFCCMTAEELADNVESVDFMKKIPECNVQLMNAYKYHALPKRQPLIKSEQTKLRNQEMLVAIGETNLFILNETKQAWEVLCSAPFEDNYPYPFSITTINNYLYVIGSRRAGSEEYKSCYRFSPRTLEWHPIAPLLCDRSRFGVANIGNYIYIFGGFEGFKRMNRVYVNNIERYSIEEDKWEQFTSDGPSISCMSSCTYENQNLIYFGGGKNANWNKISDFYCINIDSKTINKKANMLTARTTHQICRHKDSIYVLGGFDDAGNGILTVELYNIKNDQWTVVTSAPGTISKTWPHCLGSINGKLYISVFHTPNTFKIMQKGYYYDLNTNVWSEAPPIKERARYSQTCSLAFPRKVYNFDNSCITLKHEKSPINNSMIIDINSCNSFTSLSGSKPQNNHI